MTTRARLRKSKGSGSIVKRKRKGDGSTAYMLKYKTYTRTAPVTVTTMAEAEKRLRAFIAEVDSGQVDAKKAETRELAAQPTLAEWSEYFLSELINQDSEKVNTRATYGRMMSLYVLPRLGDKKLHEITPLDVIRTFKDLTGRTPALSFATIKLAYVTLRRVINAAIYPAQILKTASPVPPFDQMEISSTAKLKNSEAGRQGKVKGLNLAQVTALRTQCKTPRVRLYVDLALATGLRPGEAMGLRWCDINFDDQTVCVSGSAKLDRKTGHRWVGTTKTKKSERTLPVDPLIIEALKAELASQEDYQRQLRGEVGSVKNIEAHIKPDHCVFPLDPDTAEGLKTPIDVKRLYNWVADAGKRAGFKVSPHDLRHTHLSHVAASGELSLAEVAQRAGHASVITTANTYIHVVSENQRRAAAIGGSLISQVVEQPANVTAIHK